MSLDRHKALDLVRDGFEAAGLTVLSSRSEGVFWVRFADGTEVSLLVEVVHTKEAREQINQIVQAPPV